MGSIRYVIDHWKGRLSLGRSFWVNLFIPNLLFTYLMLGVSTQWDAVGVDYFLTGLRAYLVFFYVGILIWIWGVVGTWRSAQRARNEDGRRFWPFIAFVFLGIGIFGTGVNLASTGRLNYELTRIALGYDEFKNYDITVESDGSQITISGSLGFGLHSDLERTLRSNPNAMTLNLDSLGGRLIEARGIAELVKEYDLQTYVKTQCASACTTVFVAAGTRVISTNGQLGFHKPGLPGASNEDMKIELARQKAFFEAANVSEWFVQRMYQTPFESIWIPDTSVLIANGIITHVQSGEITMEADDYLFETTLEVFKGKEELEFLANLFVVNPALATSFIDMLRNELRQGNEDQLYDAAAQWGAAELEGSIIELVQFGDDEGVVNFLHVNVEIMQSLHGLPGNQCYAWLNGQGVAGGFDNALAPALRTRFYQNLNSLAENRRVDTPPMSDEEQERVSMEVFGKLVTQEQVTESDAALFQLPANASPSEKQRACYLIAAMYAEITRLPHHVAASYARTIFSEDVD